MVELRLKMAGHSFDFLDEISPDRGEDGRITTLMPQQGYQAANSSHVHRHGWGPFCSFSITPDVETLAGVYAICSGNTIQYIGETKDIDQRFNQEFGSIYPRNCFKDGQETNCRINTLIREFTLHGQALHVFFHETETRKALERELIKELNPPWNKSHRSSAPSNRAGATEHAGYEGKYSPLKEHLQARDDDEIRFTFAEIEDILDDTLPRSAHDYKTWWGNGNHHYSYAWLDVGWRVNDVSLSDKTVRFKRE